MAASSSGLPTSTYSEDIRLDRISIESIDMSPGTERTDDQSSGSPSRRINSGIEAGPAGFAAKGKYIPLDPKHTELGWGIVHLYRDAVETAGLYDENGDTTVTMRPQPGLTTSSDSPSLRKTDEEQCTTLCILAVPSYLTPSDFLGFVGEKTREMVSHFRMIRTDRANRYMVLMKFRSPKKARQWRKDWNGKVFTTTEVRYDGHAS
jgi:BRCA1-associated protein